MPIVVNYLLSDLAARSSIIMYLSNNKYFFIQAETQQNLSIVVNYKTWMQTFRFMICICSIVSISFYDRLEIYKSYQ